MAGGRGTGIVGPGTGGVCCGAGAAREPFGVWSLMLHARVCASTRKSACMRAYTHVRTHTRTRKSACMHIDTAQKHARTHASACGTLSESLGRELCLAGASAAVGAAHKCVPPPVSMHEYACAMLWFT